jgi:hypothetical protein
METTMPFTINFLQLLTGAPVLLDRLTTRARRGRIQGPGAVTRANPGQSPPGLWRERLRVERIHPTDLSPHLRRDIGLDF